MLKRIHQILHHDDEPPNRLEKTISSIAQAVYEIDQQLTTVNQTAQDHIVKIEELTSKQLKLKNQAKKAYQLGNQQQAKNLWNNSKLIDNQISRYQSLFDHICETQETLVNKKSELEYKQDQLRAKRSLGEINANSSRLHADIMENLMLLDNSDELSLFDEKVAQAHSKIEALKEMDGTLADNDSALLTENDHSELSQAIIQDKEDLIQANLNKVKAQYKDFFATSPKPAINESQSTKKQELLNALKTGSDCSKLMKMDNFFAQESHPNSSTEQHDRIKNFFGED